MKECEGPLSPYRVLDLSDENGQLAGRILADLGADTIIVEPVTGAQLHVLVSIPNMFVGRY